MVKDCEKGTTVQSQFFKVYLPERSSQRLLIPAAFVTHLNKVVPEKTILRSRHGRLWHVEVSRTEDGVCFQNGWQSFVRDNTIELGDMFTFKYNGDNIFDVLIFGKSGCEKEERGSYVSINSHIKEEQEKVEEEDEKDDDDDDDDDDDIDNDNNNDDDDDDDIDNDDDDDYLVNDDDNDDGDDEDDEKEEFEEEEEEVKAKTFKVKMPGCKTRSFDRGRKKIGAASNCGHKGTNAVKAEGADEGAATVKREEENAIEVERYVQPKNPYFVTRLRTGKMSNLYVPVDVLRDNNLQLCPKIILYDPNGRKWLGKVTIWKDGRTWIGGWKSLCRSNNVDKNDSCICEFLQVNGQRGNVIQVHIVRAGVQTANT